MDMQAQRVEAAPRRNSEWQDALRRCRAYRRRILDISQLEYINSTGIALLLTIARTVEQNRGKMLLTKPTQFVQELFDMTDLSGRFVIMPSLDAAREQFRN